MCTYVIEVPSTLHTRSSEIFENPASRISASGGQSPTGALAPCQANADWPNHCNTAKDTGASRPLTRSMISASAPTPGTFRQLIHSQLHGHLRQSPADSPLLLPLSLFKLSRRTRPASALSIALSTPFELFSFIIMTLVRLGLSRFSSCVPPATV